MTNQLQFNVSFPKFNFNQQFSFQSGLHVIYGESGCGKSALINQIIGLKTGHENFLLTNSSCPEEIQKIFQNPDTQIVSSTVGGELAFSLECRSKDQELISSKLIQLKKTLFFECADHRHPATLSGGEKEMLNIITAFSVDPQLVLIDDGLSFLNTERKEEVVEYIYNRIAETDCIVLWLTSDCNDFQFGVSQWELSLSSLNEWFGKIKPLMPNERTSQANNLIIECRDLCFNYNGSGNLFNSFNIKIDDFRTLGITGTNGCGKTTLAKLLLEIEKPESGFVSLTKLGETAAIAYLEQFPEKMMGADSLAEFVDRLVNAGKLDKHKISHAVNNLKNCQLDWGQIKNKTAFELPWSTLRLVLTIWLLNCEYDLLILDEPTFGLGRQQVLTLARYLELYLKNKHLIIISHDSEFIHTFCDRVFDMDQLLIKTKTDKNIYNG